jgi:hypothetical protein
LIGAVQNVAVTLSVIVPMSVRMKMKVRILCGQEGAATKVTAGAPLQPVARDSLLVILASSSLPLRRPKSVNTFFLGIVHVFVQKWGTPSWDLKLDVIHLVHLKGRHPKFICFILKISN